MIAGLGDRNLSHGDGDPAILAGILTQLGLSSTSVLWVVRQIRPSAWTKYDLLVSLRYVKEIATP